jgi:4-hydroxy-tetrahydrodipicolinate synthase
MTTRSVRLDGITPILQMPFDDREEIDIDDLTQQIEYVADFGLRAVGFGFGSEIGRLTESELWTATRAVVQRSRGAIDVMATVGGGSLVATIRQAEAAVDAGADVIMMRPPPGSADLETAFECIQRVAGIVDRPLVVQDAPTMTGVHMPAAFLARLVEQIPQIVALKIEPLQATQKIGEVAALLGSEVSILGGSGGTDFVHELRRGSHGTVPFVALSDVFVEVQRIFELGDESEARRLFHTLTPVIAVCLRSMDTAIFGFKEMLRRDGVFSSSRLRRPHEALDPQFLPELELALEERRSRVTP